MPSAEAHPEKTTASLAGNEERANCFSQLLFGWAQPLFSQAAAAARDKDRALQFEDLLELPTKDTGNAVFLAFHTAWQAAMAGRDPATLSKDERETALRSALGAVLGRQFKVAGCIKFVNTVLQFSFPVLLNLILKFIEDTQRGAIASDAPWMERNAGYWLSGLLGLFMASKAITENMYFHAVYRSAWQCRLAVTTSVYEAY